MMKDLSLTVSLPEWIENYLGSIPTKLADGEERMEMVVTLARMNADRGGGPFGAAVFGAGGEVVAVGINQVLSGKCSVLHAEIVALMLAQRRVGRFNLGGDGRMSHELVTSTEPCAMCLGAIPWSGIDRLVCGARDEDARAVGFDEGDKPAEWWRLLKRRGIEVIRDVRRESAKKVLSDYALSGGLIYNGRSDGL